MFGIYWMKILIAFKKPTMYRIFWKIFLKNKQTQKKVSPTKIELCDEEHPHLYSTESSSHKNSLKQNFPYSHALLFLCCWNGERTCFWMDSLTVIRQLNSIMGCTTETWKIFWILLVAHDWLTTLIYIIYLFP